MTSASQAPLPAATVIVVRPGERGPEVLLLKRHARAGFMANVWVFPGGRVDATDQGDDPFVTAAIRETAEEAGITLTNALTYCAHWVTPETEKKRFDTRFFLTTVPAETVAVADTTEVTDAIWLGARAALDRHAARELPLSPPTWVTLHALVDLDLDAILAWAACQTPSPIMPTLTLADGRVRVSTTAGALELDGGCWRLAPAP